MKQIIEILSRDTLVTVIKEGHRHLMNYRSLKQSEIELEFQKDLSSLSYEFLKKNLVYPDECKMFLDILSPQDIETLQEINSYNYYKLKMIIQ